MKAPLYKKASLGFVTPKKRTAKLVVTKKAPSKMSWKNPKYKPSNGKGVGY